VVYDQFKKSENSYIERYSHYIMAELSKKSRSMQMNNIRIKPSQRIDFKSKILKEYNDPSKGQKYRNIDFVKIENER
jgi:hypothetical protein